MPGPVSDSYDPEFGTREKANDIIDQLVKTYEQVSNVLGNKPPIYIGDLVDLDLPNQLTATFSEKQWRMIRFALERANDSI